MFDLQTIMLSGEVQPSHVYSLCIKSRCIYYIPYSVNVRSWDAEMRGLHFLAYDWSEDTYVIISLAKTIDWLMKCQLIKLPRVT